MNWNSLQIAKKKARKVFKKYHGRTPDLMSQKEKDTLRGGINATLGVYRKTKVFCSNPFCCGNPRRIRGTKKDVFTRQELKAMLEEKEQI